MNRRFRSHGGALAIALTLAACAGAPPLTGTQNKASDATLAPPPKSFFVDKPNFIDPEIYDGAFNPDRPPYKLQAVGALSITGVAVDSALSGNPATNLVDGNTSTAWINGKTNPPSSWAGVRLAAVTTLNRIEIKTLAMPVGTSYVVEVSDDLVSWRLALGSQRTTTTGLETKFFPAGTHGRYVLVTFRNTTTNPAVHFGIYELIVYGEQNPASPGPTPTSSPGPVPSPSPSPTPSPNLSAFYPDLRAIPPEHLMTRTVNGRLELRFDNTIPVVAGGPLQVRAYNTDTTTSAVQEILNTAGQVVQTKPVGQFAFHPAHNHFHIGDVALYQLRGGSLTSPVLLQGYKVTFCLEDTDRFQSTAGAATYTTCNQFLQGISRGWADRYTWDLPGQEFDITGYATGDYHLVTVTDPTNKFIDPDRDNEVAWTRFHFNASSRNVTVLATSPL